MAVLICPECGAENAPGDESCWACKTSLEGVDAVDVSQQEDRVEDGLDFVTPSDDDLPALLNALKADGDIADISEGGEEKMAGDSPGSESEKRPDVDESGDDIPEWLRRIRQRAQEEKDSVGEITQKISAAQDSLAEDRSGSHHENYAAWLESLRIEAQQNPEKADMEGNESKDEDVTFSDKKEPEWLRKIRREEGKTSDELGSEVLSSEDLKGDSLLQWLVDIETGKAKPESLLEAEEIESESIDMEMENKPRLIEGQDSGVTREIPVDKEAPQGYRLEVSREEQLQADQLSATIVDETAARPARETKIRRGKWIFRVGVAVVLIFILSLSLFSKSESDLTGDFVKPQQTAIIAWIEQLPQQASILIVFDYHAGFEYEMSLKAEPILQELMDSVSEIFVLSTTETGVLLSQDLLDGINGIEGIKLTHMGFIPASNYAAFSLLADANSVWQLAYAPEAVETLPQRDLDGVIVLSDTFEGSRIWIEQHQSRFNQVPLNLIVSAQAGPMLLPYYESGQVNSIISGWTDTRMIEKGRNEEKPIAFIWQAYRAGVLMMIILIVLGLLFVSNPIGDENTGGAR